MRQMAGDGEREIMMVGCHPVDMRSQGPPLRASRPPWDRCLAAVSRMHQRFSNSSAKPDRGFDCSVPAIGCPGMKYAPCGVRPDIAHHRSFDRSDIAQDRSRLQHVGDRRRDFGIGPDRHAQHHQVGTLDRLGRGLMHAVDGAQFARRCPRRLALGETGNVARQPAAADRVRHRRADQPDADQRHMIEQLRRLLRRS